MKIEMVGGPMCGSTMDVPELPAQVMRRWDSPTLGEQWDVLYVRTGEAMKSAPPVVFKYRFVSQQRIRPVEIS